MNGSDWLDKQVRVYAAYDTNKAHAPMAEGEVVYYLDSPSIGVRDAKGNVEPWSINMPMDIFESEAAKRNRLDAHRRVLAEMDRRRIAALKAEIEQLEEDIRRRARQP